MQIDQTPFPMHTHVLELKNPKVLIRPSQAESAKEKNVIVGEERHEKKGAAEQDLSSCSKGFNAWGAGQRKED